MHQCVWPGLFLYLQYMMTIVVANSDPHTDNRLISTLLFDILGWVGVGGLFGVPLLNLIKQ